MNTDRLMKAAAVIAVLLLMLNYVINLSPPSKAESAPPPFLQPGSLYKFDRGTPVKVLEIDESGWVKVQDVDAIGQPVKNQFGNTSYWVNTNVLRFVEGYAPLK